MIACPDVDAIEMMAVMIVASGNDFSTFDQDCAEGEHHRRLHREAG
jgi:hypothetical protein